jgi:predicted RNA-binding Zn-ribbon protein involved in translation (DUF1610 family)
MQKKYQLQTNRCPVCNAVLIFDKYDHHICPDCTTEICIDSERAEKKYLLRNYNCVRCGGELLFDLDHYVCKCGLKVYPRFLEKPVNKQIVETFQECISLSAGAIKPGGSKSKGRSKKHLMKKPTTKQIFDNLCR